MTKKKLKLPPLFKKAEQALRKAAEKTWLEHKRLGLPIFVWQKNKVVRIPPHRIHSR
jgi:hypothetical protein